MSDERQGPPPAPSLFRGISVIFRMQVRRLIRGRKLRLGVISVVLVLFAVVAGIVLAIGGPATYDAGTPEAALQDYLQAGLDGDAEAIADSLGPIGAELCQDELDRLRSRSSGLRFGLDDMRVDGDRAWATVSQRYGSGGDPCDGPSRANDQTFELRRRDGTWHVVDATWPWGIDRCLREAP